MTDGELNDAVARKCCGWKLTPDPEDETPPWWSEPSNTLVIEFRDDWKPSTDIAMAFSVVEKMRERGWGISMAANWVHSESDWHVELNRGNHFAIGIGDTLPIAICKAALRAVESEAKE